MIPMKPTSPSPVRTAPFRRTAVALAVLGPLLLGSAAIAADTMTHVRDTLDFFQLQVDDRIAAIGEPATKAEKTEAKCLGKVSALLDQAGAALAGLSGPGIYYETAALKVLAKVGGLIAKSGTTDPDVVLGFQSLFDAMDEWGEELDDLYDLYRPVLSDKEQAKVVKMAEKAGDLYEQAMVSATEGDLGNATKLGAKALILFAKATALTEKYASDNVL
jgi:hypothetical protein